MAQSKSDGLKGSSKPLRCAVLTAFRWDWATELLLASDGMEFCLPSASVLGLEELPNPFALPPRDSANVTVVSNIWLRWLDQQWPEQSATIIERLCSRFGPLVGLDSGDDFGLNLTPEDLQLVEVVLKPQGVYKDRDLYNYLCSAWRPGNDWGLCVRL